MASLPILYTCFSEKLNKPTTVFIVRKQGEVEQYFANYSQDASKPKVFKTPFFDDPEKGIFRLPITMRNDLGVEPRVKEGASEKEIKQAIDDLLSIKPNDLKNLRDKDSE